MILKRNHPRSSMDATIASKLAAEIPKRSYSKSDARYWLTPGRLSKNHGAADYSCRISFKGRRIHVCLNTPNHRDAAKKAAELYAKVVSEGWEAGLSNRRPDENPGTPTYSTVADLIEAASRPSRCRFRWRSYSTRRSVTKSGLCCFIHVICFFRLPQNTTGWNPIS